uniref:NR LBD domain-containing protein n=1 Tax=Panagrolaimus sp. JU765 TaxID=591449 RepID=A0AC34R4B3_9BILA
MLLSYMVDIELKHTTSQFTNSFNTPIGISNNFMKIKPDPDSNTYSLFSCPSVLNSLRVKMPGEPGRIATVEQFNHAMRSYVLLAIDWVNGIFELAQIDNTNEKMIMLKNAFGAFCTLHKGITTAEMSTDDDTIILCNGSLIPRCLPRHLFEMQFFSNNIVGKLIDEVALPFRRLMLNEIERAALTALIFLDGEFRGMSETTTLQLNMVKERIQSALFQAIRDRTSNVTMSANRYASLLLTLPGVARISTFYAENVQMAKMFGAQQMDKFVIEVVTNTTIISEPVSPTKNKHDIGIQTQRFTEFEELGKIDNELVALGLDLSANPPMTTTELIHSNSNSNSPNLPTPNSSMNSSTSSMNKPPPLIVNSNNTRQMITNSSTSTQSPIAISAPVYPFYYNNYNHNSLDNQYGYNGHGTHQNGVQSAGPFNPPTFFNQQSQASMEYQQNCFKF